MDIHGTMDCCPYKDTESDSSHSIFTPEAGLSEEEETGLPSVEKTTCLIEAIMAGQLEETRVLLNNGSNVHQRANNLPPLAYAATKAIEAPKFIQLLLDFGATLHTISGSQQFNSLHWATVYGCIDAVNFLINQGMDLERTCSQGRTPLLLAAEHGHAMVAKLLLAKGAELEHRSYNGRTALAWAACNNHVDTVEYLLLEGIDINYRDNLGHSKS
jgi:ankyrin repeat protein